MALVIFLALPAFYGATADGFVVFKATHGRAVARRQIKTGLSIGRVRK